MHPTRSILLHQMRMLRWMVSTPDMAITTDSAKRRTFVALLWPAGHGERQVGGARIDALC
jgi:hypothetical protein